MVLAHSAANKTSYHEVLSSDADIPRSGIRISRSTRRPLITTLASLISFLQNLTRQ